MMFCALRLFTREAAISDIAEYEQHCSQTSAQLFIEHFFTAGEQKLYIYTYGGGLRTWD